jgi:hypothetical protein
MNIQSLINNGVNQFVASLTKSLKPNEAAAVGQIVTGVVALVEAEAVNRNAPALLANLAKQYPAIGNVLNSIPEIAAILPPSA